MTTATVCIFAVRLKAGRVETEYSTRTTSREEAIAQARATATTEYGLSRWSLVSCTQRTS